MKPTKVTKLNGNETTNNEVSITEPSVESKGSIVKKITQ